MKPSLHTPTRMTSVQAAIGGGLATALLSVVTAQDTTVALVFSVLAPLPIMVASIVTGWIPGLAAALIAAVLVSFFEMHRSGIAASNAVVLAASIALFAVNLALPAWGLSRLLVSAPPLDASRAKTEGRKFGLLIAAVVLSCVIAIALDFGIVIAAAGGFQAATDSMIHQVEVAIQALFTIDNPLPKGTNSHDLAKNTIATIPVVAVAMWMFIAGLNLWLAARIARAFGALAAPWPDLPRSFRVPRLAAIVLAVSLGLSFAGTIIGLVALIVSSALMFAFAVQGVAMIHDVTRGKSYRLPLLIIVYLLLPYLLVVYALLGLADAGFSLRDRRRTEADAKT